MRTPVPCNGCTACCRGGEFIVLFPEHGDDPASYEHDALRSEQGEPILVLRHRDNGDCVYLGEHGCTIHGRAPSICRHFDCRRYFLSMPRNERRLIERHAHAKSEIFAEARKRLSTLSPAERQAAMAKRTEYRPEVSDRKRLRDSLVTT